MRRAPRSSRFFLAILGLFCALGLAFGGSVFAQDLREDGSAIIYTDIIIPDATPPGQTLDKKAEYFAEGKVTDLAQYLGFIYNFLISIAGLVASVMMIVGGFQYLTSAGDAGKIGAAKTRMTNALVGLFLVLGAYTILKTINPALVTLKMPGGVTAIKTELISLPWCDEVVLKKGTAVNPIWGDPNNCGSVGEFMNGKTRLACLYRSVCPVQRVEVPKSNMRSVCVQTRATSAYATKPFTSDEILKFADRAAKRALTPWTGGEAKTNREAYDEYFRKVIRDAPNPYAPGEPRPAALTAVGRKVSFFADCQSCLQYGAVLMNTPTLPDEDSGAVVEARVVTEASCNYWQGVANDGVAFAPGAWDQRKAANKPLLSYCRWMANEGGCAQADFNCEEPVATSSCGNYNGIHPFFMMNIGAVGYNYWGSASVGTGMDLGFLRARPDALADICSANPCGYNTDPVAAGEGVNMGYAVIKGPSGKKGCTGSSGIVDGIRNISTAVLDGIVGIKECVNK